VIELCQQCVPHGHWRTQCSVISTRRVTASVLVLGIVALAGACARPPAPPQAPRAAQITGVLTVDSLRAPVTVVRDRWGIPHLTAANADDLFVAQGFVQAQDRLFQMDLWRRSVQGRLSEVLGANFIDRDATTRRIQFRGDLDAEWASYGSDVQTIARAFTRGINAWVAISRADPPEEFRLAGWLPEYWRPEDLLNRTDAFLASGGAQDELLRARLIARLGASAVDRLLPAPDGPRGDSTAVDLPAINFVVGDVLRRIGTAPFFTTLAGPVSPEPRPASNAWGLDGGRTATGRPLVAVDPHRPLDAPSVRYLIHLTAPGWDVAGATAPWLPGVIIGHNQRVAWGMTAWRADTQDIVVERVNPSDARQVERDGRWVDMSVDDERVAVKGRTEPFRYERLYTSNGVIVAVDNDRHLAYALRWSGTEPGGAGELAALALDRTTSGSEFQAALSRWNMPPAEFVVADIDGRLTFQRAGLLPRRTRSGDVPQAGWTGGELSWPDRRRTRPRDDGAPGAIVSANGDRARTARIVDLLGRTARATVDDMKRIQLDVTAANAGRLIPLLQSLHSLPRDAAPLRQQLLDWDRRIAPDSAAAALYIAWEESLARLLATRRVPSEFVSEVAARLDVVDLYERPTSSWFDGPVDRVRDQLLVDSLIQAGRQRTAPGQPQSGAQVTFAHPLAVFEAARRRFNVGPFPLPGYPHTVFATDGRNGPSLRVVFDLSNWDRSVTINAPGQSGSPASVHYDDMARLWAKGDYVPLAFSPDAVKSVTADVLTLRPR
jgi:penicillin amidase